MARADVQRSIAFVVDDLSLSFESFEPTRKALHKYIDTDYPAQATSSRSYARRRQAAR